MPTLLLQPSLRHATPSPAPSASSQRFTRGVWSPTAWPSQIPSTARHVVGFHGRSVVLGRIPAACQASFASTTTPHMLGSHPSQQVSEGHWEACDDSAYFATTPLGAAAAAGAAQQQTRYTVDGEQCQVGGMPACLCEVGSTALPEATVLPAPHASSSLPSTTEAAWSMSAPRCSLAGPRCARWDRRAAQLPCQKIES